MLEGKGGKGGKGAFGGYFPVTLLQRLLKTRKARTGICEDLLITQTVEGSFQGWTLPFSPSQILPKENKVNPKFALKVGMPPVPLGNFHLSPYDTKSLLTCIFHSPEQSKDTVFGWP